MSFIVKIGYKKFKFDNYNDAIQFAMSAVKSQMDKDDEVIITINIKEED